MAINEENLHNSVTVQIYPLNIVQFLQIEIFQRFLSVISTLFDNLVFEDIRVFSVQNDKKEKLEAQINVSFFVVQNEEQIRYFN